MTLDMECENCGKVGSHEPLASARPPMFWIADLPCDRCGGRIVVLYPRNDATVDEVAALRQRALSTALDDPRGDPDLADELRAPERQP